MKIFKGLLVIIVLCACGSMFARIVTGKGTTKEQVAPVTTKEQPKQTYATLLNQIRTGRTDVTVFDMNNLTPSFIDFIKNNAIVSDLSNMEVEALLQAGANLNAKWSGDLQRDSSLLEKLNLQINSETNQFLPSSVFYDPTTAMFKEEYLKNIVQKLSKIKKTNQEIIDTILNQYLNNMKKIWASENIEGGIDVLTNVLKDQVTEAVTGQEGTERKTLPTTPSTTKPTTTSKKPQPQPKPKPTEIDPSKVPAPTDLPPKLEETIKTTAEPTEITELRTKIANLVNQNKADIERAYDHAKNKNQINLAILLLTTSGIVQKVRKIDTSSLAKNLLSEILNNEIGEELVNNLFTKETLTSTQAINDVWENEEIEAKKIIK